MRSDNRKKKKTGVKPVVILAVLILTAVILAALLFFRSGRLPFFGYVGIDVSGVISESFSEAAADGSYTLKEALDSAGNGEITLSDIGFDSIFEGTVILGDSVTEGISGYGYLSEDKVFCRVGGSVLNSSDEIPKAAATNPEIAFFSFGSNEMGMFSGDADYFTQKYEEFIRSFMELSPDTEIYVNSVPKPSDSRIMAGGHKKVILLFAGTAWLRSCRFLFHQFVHRDKAHKVIGDADALSALPAALVRRFDVDAFDKLPQGVRGHFLQILVFVYPLDELLQIFNLSFLYFDFLLQGLDFHFKLRLLVLIGLAH